MEIGQPTSELRQRRDVPSSQSAEGPIGKINPADLPAKARQTLDSLQQKLPASVPTFDVNVLQQRAKEAVQQVHLPQSAAEAWNALPTAWRYTLGSDIFVWGVLGFTCLFVPSLALSAHYRLAHMLGWAGPSVAVASHTLLMWVRAAGAIMLSLCVPVASAFFRQDAQFARWYGIQRLVLGACLSFIILSNLDKSTYKVLIPFALHSVWHGSSLLISLFNVISKAVGYGQRSAAAGSRHVQSSRSAAVTSSRVA